MNTLRRLLLASAVAAGSTTAYPAGESNEIVEHTMLMDHGDGHLMDMDGGMIMGQNKDRLPDGCSKIAATKEVTVRAGHKYSKKFPGTMFAFDQQEFRFEPCTKLTVHFINEDHIRHQWMMHGLPKYMYDKGMFHLEVTGPAKISGTLILPNEDKTYLVHCDIAQHMEKGMKAQLIVGKGSAPFPSIPGLTDQVIRDHYGPGPAPTQVVAPADVDRTGMSSAAAPASAPAPEAESWFSGMTVIGALVGAFGAPFAARAWGGRLARLTAKDAGNVLAAAARRMWDHAVVVIEWVVRQIRARTG
ncbi:cupredoxin domain-containing protein [Methylotetracoccus oryzae]|uniref:copper oxidase n=1 Tax=Methylotetracoccus oryzae TaxID=1919059 RepID=UPI00111B1A05|nr:copper oxidase [Methylotetracoccus oryzae]